MSEVEWVVQLNIDIKSRYITGPYNTNATTQNSLSRLQLQSSLYGIDQ